MRRGTTPKVRLSTNADLSGCEVMVALRNGRTTIMKSGDDLDISSGEGGSSVECRLTQEETLGLDPLLPVRFQMRFKRGDDACATEIKQVKVEDVLYEGVI